MFLKFRSAFKMQEDVKECGKIRSPYAVIGLKIVVQISEGKSNIVLKPSTRTASRRSLPCYSSKQPTDHQYSCYLKSCHLCNKKLSLDKEVYMYRGDQGFCSIECRDRQIVVDEMRELENSTKQIVASYRHCNNGGDRRETQILIEELRRQRHNSNNNYKPQYSKKIHWTIVT
ncbi:Protein of unknown function (DUF581) [Melia azedarach]|uniref:Uncharacterized protein n=1 Tax=Melia azedarach TaxID=155640 RepID=A0ACC1Y418_MELAZ|nr:Protein of unknown function (DUF581) [Melia azedarach]